MTDIATDSSSGSWPARAVARLAHLAPSWFVVVMGWCGLAQAWLRAEGLLGEWALGAGLVAAAFALVVFGLLGLACIVRLQVHPDAVHADLLHPVRHAFMAALPISMLLLASLGVHLFGGTDATLDMMLIVVWLMGSVLQLWSTWWVLARWLRAKESRGLMWQHFTPVLFIPVVGNVLAPIGGVPLGLGAWATAQFGVGLFLWPVLVALLVVRMVEAGPLPARMAPTLFVSLAPPSLVGLSLLTLHAPNDAVWAVWGMGFVFPGLGIDPNPCDRQPRLCHAALGHELSVRRFHHLDAAFGAKPRRPLAQCARTGAAGFGHAVDPRLEPAHLARLAPRHDLGARAINGGPSAQITSRFVRAELSALHQ